MSSWRSTESHLPQWNSSSTRCSHDEKQQQQRRRRPRQSATSSPVALYVRYWAPLSRPRRIRLATIALCLVLVLFSPVIRHDYIKTWPKKAAKDLQDPHWWLDPWTLPSSRFPRTVVYPDPDWNPSPVWLPTPVSQLKGHPPPSTFHCNNTTHPYTPTESTTSFSGATVSSSPLLFMGIFSTAPKRNHRNLIRRRQLPHYKGTPNVDSLLGGKNASFSSHSFGDMGVPAGVLEHRFILGYPPKWSHTVAMVQDGSLGNVHALIGETPWGVPTRESSWWQGDGVTWWRRWFPIPWTAQELSRAREHIRIMESVAEEASLFSDVEVLPLEDSIIKGKTYHYFRWLARTRAKDRPPRFAMKTDDDTFHILPNLLAIFDGLSCSTNYYIGTSWGCSQPFPFHFGGLGYALSWPLVSWLGAGDELPSSATDNQEDARLGSYLTALDRQREPVITLDYGVRMGSFFQPEIFPQNTETIALHYLKEEVAYRDYSQRMWDVWKAAGKKWRWHPKSS